ncbi:MAG: GntR family transcriptional regulator [Clostridia bacterium]
MDKCDAQRNSIQNIGLQLKTTHTAASQIYHMLKEQIVTLQLLPGATLSEQETATLMGVSRTPVREAFIRLSREKMLLISPQRRTAVSQISVDRVRQERFLRESLEQAALEQFILNPSEAYFAKMETVIACQRQAIEQQDLKLFFQYDDDFHKLFYTATNYALCQQVIDRNCFDYKRLRFLSSCASMDTQALNLKQHETLMRLAREHALGDAQALLRKHLRRLFDELKVLQEMYPQYFV